MQTARHGELNEQGCSTNQFNNAEYKRWSEGISGKQSIKTQWGVEAFFGAPENKPAGREDMSISLTLTSEK